MKTIFPSIAAVLLLIGSETLAQVQPSFAAKLNRFALGAHVTEFAYDFGFGLEVTTPAVWNEHFSLRVTANRYWLEPLSTETNQWQAFHTGSIYLVYNSRLYDNARFYIEGGTFTVVGNKSTSTQRLGQGIAGTIGLEMFVAREAAVPISYFFSAGFGRCKTFMDAQSEHAYGEGLVVNTGFRFYL